MTQALIIDSSVLIAILRCESEAERFVEMIASARKCFISAANYLETALVIDSERNPIISRKLDDLIACLEIIVSDITPEHAQIARNAYRDFGKGSGHPAGLNFGDCFSYALAKQKALPLLFKGNDFIHTDVEVAFPV